MLTGAGISKESGIDTFRDEGGLWNRVNLEEVATLEAWHSDKKKVLDFYNDTRRTFRAAHIVPNAAHTRWPAGEGIRRRSHRRHPEHRSACMRCQVKHVSTCMAATARSAA